MIYHFSNIHNKCNVASRCKTDPNYEPSKSVIKCDTAKKLFLGVLHSSTIYKNYHNFSGAKETHYVESFNNVMNIFQDKRISFTDEEYKTRAHLATIHWNENVDRHFISVWKAPAGGSRKVKEKKNYQEATYALSK